MSKIRSYMAVGTKQLWTTVRLRKIKPPADQRRRARQREPRAGVEPSEEGHALRVPERPAEHPNRLERGPPQHQRSCRSLRQRPPQAGRGEGGGA